MLLAGYSRRVQLLRNVIDYTEMLRTKRHTWLLLLATCCTFISTGYSSIEIWRSGVMAMSACEQWAEFNKTGRIPEPIKSTGNRKLCGWFKKGVQGDACADIRHFWLGCKIDNSTSRIIGGFKARRNGYPSALLFGGNRCGASILNEEWALTAAHCLEPDGLYYLYAGFRLANDNGSAKQEVKTKKLFTHPNYNESDYHDDIALMKFTPKLKFNDAVQPVRLAEENSFHTEGEIGMSIGWGEGSSGGLSAVELAVITVEKCRDIFRSKNITVTDVIVCGQYPSGDVRNACNGDSGSPFYVCENHKLLQIGVADFIGGCQSYYPVGYARVSKFRKWIEETMAEN